MIHAGVPFLVLGLEDRHVPTFRLLLYCTGIFLEALARLMPALLESVFQVPEF